MKKQPRVLLVGLVESFARWTTYVTGAVIAAGYLLTAFRWGQRGPCVFIRSHVQLLWSAGITASVVVLWIWAARLRNRFSKGFVEDFKTDLGHKWDFVGPWQVTEDGVLLVTGSDQGGLTKVGALWENYTLTFEAKIVNQCLGVIARAQNLDNYYMLQIGKARIRPHRRVAVPVVEAAAGNAVTASPGPVMHPVSYTVGWQVFDDFAVDLGKPLDGWSSFRLVARGESLALYINDDLAWRRESFLKIPTGKIGFRNWASEQALVRKVRVTLDS
jgi:hypothetical protein